MSIDYQEYLLSETWQERRKAALEWAENRCQICNSDKELNVHHRTYERLGNERLADLTVLCKQCHSSHHMTANKEAQLQILRGYLQGKVDADVFVAKCRDSKGLREITYETAIHLGYTGVLNATDEDIKGDVLLARLYLVMSQI